MKALLVIFTICISDTLCKGVNVSGKNYPKKYGGGKILINSSKYDKAKSYPLPVQREGTSYTAFNVVGSDPQMIQAGIPDSPYFPIDQYLHQKSSVKKVLPEKPGSLLRNKRSADVSTVAPAEKEEKKVEPKAAGVHSETKPVPTAAAPAAAVQYSSTAGNQEETTVIPPSSPKEESKSTTTISTTTGKLAGRSGKTRGSKAPKPVLKSKAVPKKNSGSLKHKGNKAVVVKPKGKEEKPHLKRTHPKSPKKNKKRKVNAKRSKNRKAKSKKARAGKAPKETRRLTGAREALIEDYPYVVSIQKNEQHWCSGALLSPRMVITTANCLWKANRISRMEVRAGSRHANRGGQIAGIQEVMKHPEWGLRKSPDNDVALLLLDKNIKFSDKVHGVDLPNNVMLPPFDDAWITSWGAERRDGVYDYRDSMTLQVYYARLIEREKCNNVTMRFSVVVSENFICLAQSGRQAPCTRDTGAPAVSDGVLWGLASWGIRKLCGTERYPAMFSYIASQSNMDFIMNATTYLMTDKRQYPFADRHP